MQASTKEESRMFVVAGATGHVGRVCALELLNKGQKVKVVVRDAAKGAEWSKRGAEVAVAALGDAKAMTDALKGATGFFSLLPMTFAEPDFYAYQRKTADAIATAVKNSRVPHVVMLSSVGANLDAGNGPIKGLNYLEKVLRETGTVLTAIRAGSFQENVGNSIAPAKNAGIFPSFFPSIDIPMQMIATKDIGKVAAEQLVAHPAKSEVIDLHGPTYTNREVVKKLGERLGKELKVVDVPQAGWLDALEQAGMPRHMAEVIAEMYSGFMTGKIFPVGDRMMQGQTPLDETLGEMLS
jgi:uncharacterized protein YbjT (DUF2867 family)